MNNKTIGHVFGTDLNQIDFAYNAEMPNGEPTNVELGQIVAIEDQKSSEVFLARVSNIAYGQDKNWSKEIARNYNLQEEFNIEEEHEDPKDVYQPDNRNQRFYEAHCELLGYINQNKKFLTPKKLPPYFSRVRNLQEEDINTGELSKKFGDVSIGRIRSGSSILNIPAGIYLDYIPYHIGMFAVTGKGKSNTSKRLLGQFLESEGRISPLIFDPHNEYIKDLVKHPYAKDWMRIYDQKGTQTGVEKIRISYSDITVETILSIRVQLNLTEPQERFLYEAESRYGEKTWFREILENPVDEGDEDDGSDMAEPNYLRREFRNTHPDTIRATKSKLQRLANATYITRDSNVSNIQSILNYLNSGITVLIDTYSLHGLMELFLISILSKRVLENRKQISFQNPDKFEEIPPVTILIEEAQRVLGKGTNSEVGVFASICNEGRKFKTGLFAITQQPKNINNNLISQFNTFIILGISDQPDFDILENNAKNPIQKLQTDIKSLMPGEAIITNPLAPFAIPLKIDLWDDYLEDVKKRKKTGNDFTVENQNFKNFFN